MIVKYPGDVASGIQKHVDGAISSEFAIADFCTAIGVTPCRERWAEQPNYCVASHTLMDTTQLF